MFLVILEFPHCVVDTVWCVLFLFSKQMNSLKSERNAQNRLQIRVCFYLPSTLEIMCWKKALGSSS